MGSHSEGRAGHGSDLRAAERPRARIGVFIAESGATAEASAAALAVSLRLPLVAADALEDAQRYDLLLTFVGDRLELRSVGRRAPGPVFVDLITLGLRHLSHPTGLLQQPIARAVGARGERPKVLDATAGLGRDAWLLACLGCHVQAIERCDIVAALLRNGMERASYHARLRPILEERLTLRVADAREVLAEERREPPDVVYLDPMFAPKGKSALVKKEMRVLRLLVGDDRDSRELLEAARRVAVQRVVVKRLLHAPPLAADLDHTHRGKIARYDVYMSVRRC